MSEFEELLMRYNLLLEDNEVLQEENDDLADRVMELHAICIANGFNPDGLSEVP